MGVGFILLLIVCANISNLQFSRSLSRRPEIAIRTAIGASRPRILRQLLTESILLGLCGGVVGIVLARINIYVNLMAMPQRIARYMPGWSNISLDWRALGYSVALTLIVGIISGIAPAYAAMRVGVSEQLKAGSRTLSDTAKSHRLRNLFAIAQIALSVALVIGASLMATGTYAMLKATQSYDPDHLLTFSIALPEGRYVTAAQQTAFLDQSLDRFRSIPGVLSADLTTALPYNNTGVWVQDFVIEHNPTLPGQFRNTQRITITPEYLASMKIPLVSGRLLSASDAAGTMPVATVSRSFAQRYFPNQNPIGQRIQLGKDASGTPWLTVVGVVGDALTIWVDRVPQPAVYLSYRQFPVGDPTFAVRTNGNPLTLAPAVRHSIASVDGSLPVDNLESYRAYLHESLIGLIYVVATLAANAGIALLLSALGIFGVMANTVTERTQEIGIRLALGAERTHIEAMVIRRGLILAGVGLALGLPLAFGLARGVSSLIYGTDAGNHLIFSLTTLTIVVVALLATWLPAHRAAGIEPMSALRSE
jgi:putative ABC transport system permease protein